MINVGGKVGHGFAIPLTRKETECAAFKRVQNLISVNDDIGISKGFFFKSGQMHRLILDRTNSIRSDRLSTRYSNLHVPIIE